MKTRSAFLAWLLTCLAAASLSAGAQQSPAPAFQPPQAPDRWEPDIQKFEAQDKQFMGAVEVTEVNGPDIKSENDFGKMTVAPVVRRATAEGKRLRYSFPPHSYTMLKGRLG